MVKISSVFKTDEVKEEDRKQIREALHWKHSIVAQVTLKRPICIPQMEDPCECPPGTKVLDFGDWFDYDQWGNPTKKTPKYQGEKQNKKMKWKNLLQNNCPQCNKSFLEHADLDKPQIRCICGFTIAKTRMSEIVNDMMAKDLEQRALDEESLANF